MTGSTWDVAIVGAGPAGSALAMRLADAGVSVVLFEAARFDRPRVGESLTPSVRPLLDDLGVWDAVLGTNPIPSWGTRSIWSDPGADADTHSHLSNPYGQGWHVDRRAFDEALATAAADRGAELRLGTRVTKAVHDDRGWRLDVGTETDDGAAQQVAARVVIDASGRNGRLARVLGARRLVFDHLVAVGRTWHDVESADQCVLVEAVPEGWWYSAPLPGRGQITLLMTDADVCRAGRLTEDDTWLNALGRTRETGGRVSGATVDGPVRSNAACSGRTIRSDTRPWLSVGDAALAVDPLTGSGVTRALRTAEAAAGTVLDVLARPDDDRAGAAASIEAYEHDRNRACQHYLHERLAFYAAGPAVESVFWSRRRQVAERVASTSGGAPLDAVGSGGGL